MRFFYITPNTKARPFDHILNLSSQLLLAGESLSVNELRGKDQVSLKRENTSATRTLEYYQHIGH